MKHAYSTFILSLLLLIGCDYQGEYVFIVKNETQKTITFRFSNESNPLNEENKEEVVIAPSEEKIVRIVDAPLNDPAHDCFTEHGIAYFTELVFDTYIDGIKIEKQLWQSQNWKYHKNSKWSAEYYMTLTDKLLETDRWRS